MKITKRVLAILLALALGLALLAPAAFAEDAKPPVFTKVMAAGLKELRAGETIVLEAGAKLPNGVDAELKYQWYATDWLNPANEVFSTFTKPSREFFLLEGETGPQLEVSVSAEELSGNVAALLPAGLRFYCLKAYYTADDGSVAEANDYGQIIGTFSFEDLYFHMVRLVGSGPTVIEVMGKTVFKVLLYPLIVPLYLMLKLFVPVYAQLYK